MKMLRTFTRIGIIFMVLCISTGCRLFPPGNSQTPRMHPGFSLVQFGEHLYQLGGIDTASHYLDRVLIATIQDPDDLSYLTWKKGTPLPKPLAFFAAFTSGRRLFIIGGENAEGPQNSIYYTYIHDDGRLDELWRENAVRLPYPLSRMGFVLHDGRIFLAGGKTDSGASDSIIHARISPSISIGQW